MILKLFIFAFLLECLVLASQDIAVKQATITENDSSIDHTVDSSINNDLETLFNESPENSEITSTTQSLVTETEPLVASNNSTLNATEIGTNTTENLTEVTTVLDNNSTDNDNATNSTDTEEENTVIPTVTIPEEVTETENATVSTTPSTTVTPTTETELTSPEPETTIDPKYRNETLELYLENFLRDNPLARKYESPGFPAPYEANLNLNWSITLSNCTGIDVVVHFLDLNPFQPDSLNIRGGDENATDEEGIKLTGRQFNVVYKIIHTTTLFIWFNSGPETEEYQGFVLTYSPFGDDTPIPTTTEAPITSPPSDIQTYLVQLVLLEVDRTNATWQKFKEVLASSASKYVIDQNLHIERAHPENVTIHSVLTCPDNLPNYKSCMRLEFSIPLWNLDFNPELDFDPTIFAYELSADSLAEMWDLYGRDDFLAELGIEEYSPPDGTYVLLLWTGISLSIIVIFVGVLYSIWKIDIFREYRRMYNKNDDQQDILKVKSDLDISMYPIPHQPYPTLFETNEVNSGGYYDLSEINSSSFQNHNFHQEIHQEKPSTPSNYRLAKNHFSPNIMDFNDLQFFPDDEEDFGRVQSMSPRSKQKLLVLGAKRDESIT